MKNQATARRYNSFRSQNHSDSHKSQNNDVPTLNLIELKRKEIAELVKIAREYNIENASSMRRQELIFGLLQAQTKQNGGDIWRRGFRNLA